MCQLYLNKTGEKKKKHVLEGFLFFYFLLGKHNHSLIIDGYIDT